MEQLIQSGSKVDIHIRACKYYMCEQRPPYFPRLLTSVFVSVTSVTHINNGNHTSATSSVFRLEDRKLVRLYAKIYINTMLITVAFCHLH